MEENVSGTESSDAGWPASPPPEPKIDLEQGRGVFEHILVGVDLTPESLEAVRQAKQLLEPGGTLDVVTALELATTAGAGFAEPPAAAQLEAESKAALDAAREVVPDASFRVVEGRADQVLMDAARADGATLVAVGSHGISRPVGIALGSAATGLLHSAHCSVLIARGQPQEGFPRGIVAGVDGSSESELAAAVAFGLGRRFGADVWPIAARNGKGFDITAVDGIATNVLIEDGSAVDALVAGAGRADLLVVGSRGLSGVRALGSVSERVAHQAPCSVLVVRQP